MEERKFDFSALGIFAAFIQTLRDLEIHYEYWQENDGSYGCGSDVFTMWGEGVTLDEAVNDLIKSLRICAEDYCEDISRSLKYGPENFLPAIKIMFCSDEEIKQCLRGELLKDI